MEVTTNKQTDNRTSYIDRNGNPRGNWCKIIGDNLARWNAERDKENGKSHKEC